MDATALATVIVSMILERPLCLSCIAKKAGVTQLRALRTIERVQTNLRVVMEGGGRCHACGSTVGPVASVVQTD